MPGSFKDKTYLTAETDRGDGELWLVRKSGTKQRLDYGLKGPSAIVFSPDGLWLMVTQRRSRFGYGYRVKLDGTLDAREPFYAFVVPESAYESSARGAWMDQEGRAYVATAGGVQIFDRNGRVTAILPLPNGAPATAISFGGSDFKTLNVAAGGTIYPRRLRVTGAPPWADAIKLPPWSPG